jgi:hypothetical protein
MMTMMFWGRVNVGILMRDQLLRAVKLVGKIFIPARFRPAYWSFYFSCYDHVQSRWGQLCVKWHWHIKPARRPHGLPAELVLSLTSYPPRFRTLSLTLRSLLRQTVKPDRTILWIAHADIPLLPKDVRDLQAAGLEIRATDDTKSYKKTIPALDAFPDAFICTADDDAYYRPTWLEQLVEGMSLTERLVTCHRAHQITLDANGRFQPYAQWLMDVRKRGKSELLFPTGVGGVLYPPGILAHTADDRVAAFTLSPHADDIWLYWIARRNGAIYKTVGRWCYLVLWRGTQDQALYHRNFTQGGNDDQIRKMTERYGCPAGNRSRGPVLSRTVATRSGTRHLSRCF